MHAGYNAEVCALTVWDGRLVSGSLDKTIKLWDVGEGSCLVTIISGSTYQISQLQTQVVELMSTKASNVNNYNIAANNLKPLTDKGISEHIGKLSLDFILEGAKGYADFATLILLKIKYKMLMERLWMIQRRDS